MILSYFVFIETPKQQKTILALFQMPGNLKSRNKGLLVFKGRAR